MNANSSKMNSNESQAKPGSAGKKKIERFSMVKWPEFDADVENLCQVTGQKVITKAIKQAIQNHKVE